MIIRSRTRQNRRGLVILEFSLALPVLILLTLGTTVLGLGVSQFQLIATVAREGSRWASVRGTEYQQTTGNPAATATTIYSQAILPKATGMAPGDLTYTVTWSPNNQPGSTVTVTVNYQWTPLAYMGAIDISSTSVMTVEY